MKPRHIVIGVVVALGLCSCGDDESSADSDSLSSERPPRPEPKTSRKSSNRTAKSDESKLTPSGASDAPETEDPPASGKAVVKLDPSIPLPRSAEERAERREARESGEQAERVARITEQISIRLKEQDANGDGLLSKDEIPGPFAGGFDEVDTNKDGQLDEVEQAAMIQGLTEMMSSFGNRSRRGRGSDGPGGGRGSRDR
jgi:hypothetical protein